MGKGLQGLLHLLSRGQPQRPTSLFLCPLLSPRAWHTEPSWAFSLNDDLELIFIPGRQRSVQTEEGLLDRVSTDNQLPWSSSRPICASSDGRPLSLEAAPTFNVKVLPL